MNVRRVVVVAVALLVLAAVVGWLWVLLSPAPEIIVDHPNSGRYASEADPAKLFAGVAIFGLLNLGLGVVIALVSWFGLRFTRGPAGLTFVTVMSLATSALALKIGTALGRQIRGEIDLSVPGDYRGTVNLWLDGSVGPSWLLLICAPTAAVLVYLICVLSSSRADLGIGDDVPAVPDGFRPMDATMPEWPAPAAAESATSESGAAEGVTSEGEGPRTRP